MSASVVLADRADIDAAIASAERGYRVWKDYSIAKRQTRSASTSRSPCPSPITAFGGWKASLFGDAKAYGTRGLDFFTREKAITSRRLDPATHAAENEGPNAAVSAPSVGCPRLVR